MLERQTKRMLERFVNVKQVLESNLLFRLRTLANSILEVISNVSLASD